MIYNNYVKKYCRLVQGSSKGKPYATNMQ